MIIIATAESVSLWYWSPPDLDEDFAWVKFGYNLGADSNHEGVIVRVSNVMIEGWMQSRTRSVGTNSDDFLTFGKLWSKRTRPDSPIWNSSFEVKSYKYLRKHTCWETLLFLFVCRTKNCLKNGSSKLGMHSSRNTFRIHKSRVCLILRPCENMSCYVGSISSQPLNPSISTSVSHC